MIPQRTEPIRFEWSTAVSDGASGTLPGETRQFDTLAVVRALKSSRLLEANQTSLRQGYSFTIWVNPDFEPKAGYTLIYRDERLAIQGYRYTDETRKKYEITALEGINGADGHSGQGS